MTLRVKNWHKFQHFKDRKPPWVKLYRDLLDDKEWFDLDPVAAKALVLIWLIASEAAGELPPMAELAFRLHQSERQTKTIVSSLSHWLEQDDIAPISAGYQSDPLETERETEVEVERETDARGGFAAFWLAYPRKIGKGDAEKLWLKLNPSAQLQVEILLAVTQQANSEQWQREGGRFVPMPSTWLNQKRWGDSLPTKHDQTRNVIEEAERLTFGSA